MEDKINLKEMEKRSWRYTMQDGLMEVFLGLLLVGAGILLSSSLTSAATSIYAAFFIIFGIPALERLRKRFTYPRIGYVKLHEESGWKTAKGIFLYMFVVAAIMAIAISVLSGEVNANLIYKSTLIFMAMMFLGAFSYLQGKSGSKRVYPYAILALVGGIIFSVLDVGPNISGLIDYLLFMGSVFTITGSTTFISFLRKYPLPKEEMLNENSG
jgi:MFS family permease